MLITRLLLLGFFAVLQGCVSVPETKPSANITSKPLYLQHLQDIEAIQEFSMQARIGVQTDGKGFSGGLSWQHNEANDDIILYSPLGGQVASIRKSPTKVTLEDANGKSISAENAELLTQTALGWRLPLSGLADWSLGRPNNSDVKDISWDERGFLSTLKQDGWDIQYLNYAEINGHYLPSKILLKSEKINLKLLVEKWDTLGK